MNSQTPKERVDSRLTKGQESAACFFISANQVDDTLPSPFQEIPRLPLTLGPSPIHYLQHVSRRFLSDYQRDISVFVKREDLNSGLAFGGNKTRKLEYLAAEASNRQCNTLVSVGGIQSNHTRQVAAVAKYLGMETHLINKNWVQWEDSGYEKVGNIQLSKLMDAKMTLNPEGFSITETTEDSEAVQEILKKLKMDPNCTPYWIPAGASDHPLGGLGFARWAFEVAEQEKKAGMFFNTIIVCAVTGSTFAGMIAGFKLLQQKCGGKPRKIVGIDGSAKPSETFDQVLKIARKTAALIGLEPEDIAEEDIILKVEYAGPAYGVPDEMTVEAIKYAAKEEALILDPVYEGKSFAGLIELCKSGEIKGGNVLFAHLGGQLALNAYTEMDKVLPSKFV